MLSNVPRRTLYLADAPLARAARMLWGGGGGKGGPPPPPPPLCTTAQMSHCD